MGKHIQQLIEQGEHQQLDFKYAITDAKKIARTFSAFANTDGGTLLIGVKDNGAITGVRTDEEAHMIELAAHIYCKPQVNYTIKPWIIHGKQILEVIVNESTVKPHMAPWKNNLYRAFVRVNDQNFVANSIQVAVWKKKRNELPVLVKYSRIEKDLLSFLQKNQSITLKEFRQHCKVSYPVARKVLINLVAINVLKINQSEDITHYVINADGYSQTGIISE